MLGTLGLSFTCLGAKVWKWKVQMKGRDALNGGGLVKEAEMPVHRQMKATLV